MSDLPHERLSIPEGFPVGALFGRAGRHLKDVKSRTGAQIYIDGSAGTISIRAPSAATVHAAATFYRRCFQEHMETERVQPVAPTKAIILLSPRLAEGARFMPVPATDEFASAVETRKALYLLAPAPAARIPADGSPPAADGAAPPHSAPTDVQLLHAQPPVALPDIVAESAAGGAATLNLALTVVQAVHTSPPYSIIKLRFNMGRQFFCAAGTKHSSLAAFGALSLSDIEGLRVGPVGDLGAFFSNAVPLPGVSSLTARLQELGFTHSFTKRTVTVHLIQRDTFRSHAVTFLRTEDGQLKAAKVQKGKFKLFFLVRVGDAGTQLDTRMKLLATRAVNGQGFPSGPDQVLLEVAQGCWLEGSRIVLPPTHRASLLVDRVRFKDKEMWLGSAQLPGSAGGTCSLQVAIVSVRDEEGRHHVEIGASCPTLNALLKRQLEEASANGPQLEGDQELGAASTSENGASSSSSGSSMDEVHPATYLPYIQALHNLCQGLR